MKKTKLLSLAVLSMLMFSCEQETAKVTESVSFKTSSDYENVLDALEEEALRLTNNLDETNTNLTNAKTTGWFRSSKWRPSGRITVWDDTADKRIGIKGIKVRIGNWFKWRTAFTNEDGGFSCDTTGIMCVIKWTGKGIILR